jgi:hypothetical protein
MQPGRGKASDNAGMVGARKPTDSRNLRAIARIADSLFDYLLVIQIVAFRRFEAKRWRLSADIW